MFIYQDHFVELTLLPETRILGIRWLDSENSKMFEFEASFELLIDTINNLTVQKLLIYNNHSISTIPEEALKSKIILLCSGLTQTSLVKLARIRFENEAAETIIKKLTDDLQLVMASEITFAYQTFNHEAEATTWLIAETPD